jgi:hypothetical protein
MFTKLGESFEINLEKSDSCVPLVNEDILNEFRKTAAELKKIAPKAEDFLYFSAVMMHAAEAAAINDDGTPKLTLKGEPVKVSWDKSNNTWRWVTNDVSIKPTKNANGDIFPECELIKAYKNWIGKPLCIDHKSSSVDHVRGFIVDAYYDRNLKRVVALCALDKHNYPDLARKVATGYSNSVSMGTSVATAICYDCGRVARTEADFCEHMKSKSCYGEINVGLNPIELSIVVNGADPKAKIKHIIAAANTLNNYVDTKEKELKKSADLQKLEDTIKDVLKQLEDLKKAESEEMHVDDMQEEPVIDTMDESPIGTDVGPANAPPHERFASIEAEMEDYRLTLKSLTASIEAKIGQMRQDLNKLLTISTNKQEENMSGSNINKQGYYQGTEEPAPGQPKYTKDPLNEKLRTDGDKHMTGQMDTGPVDGMHPGPDSVGMSELERKKMLARAESEERAIRRNAVVNLAKQAVEQKKAYFQGGGDVNEPTPGKPKYPVDKMQYDLREKGDKHMLGQKPFPDVGKTTDLHPSPASADVADELKRKQMLQRASLKARFTKASNDDGTHSIGKSAWEVYLGDKLLLTASVDELSGGRSEMLYDTIATKEFGSKLIEKVKVQGADKVKSLIKSAQDAPAPAAPMPAAEPAAPAPEMPEAAPAAEVEDVGKKDDPKERALELAQKVSDLSSDLLEAVKALTGEAKEMGEEGAELAPAEMGTTASTLNTLRKELNGALTQAMKESVAALDDHKEELDMIVGLYNNDSVNNSNQDLVGSVVEDAINDAKTAVADGFKLMTAFVKYARGSQAIVKRAQMEADLNDLAGEEPMDMNNDSDLMGLLEEEDLSDLGEPEDEDLVDEDLVDEDLVDEDLIDDNDAKVMVDDPKLANPPAAGAEVPELSPEAKVASFNTKEGRAIMRAKLAAEALKFSPMLDQAHPKGGFTTDLDVKPEGDLAKVEDLEEMHEQVLDVATAPPKVRKEAEAIHKLVSEGKLDPADLDALVAEGLDKDAVAYYKKYWGQVDGGSEFASELVKEHVKALVEEELNKYRVKLARSYELAYDMVDRGLCPSDRDAVSSQVDEIMKFNDESFDSLKRVVAKHNVIMRKEASGVIPQVGLIGSGEINPVTEESFSSLLSAALNSSTTKRMF